MITQINRIERAARRQNIPIEAHLDLTFRCNFICEHCILPTQFGAEELSTDEVRRLLRELAAEGTLFLTLSGGEVFLRKDLDEILVAADELHFRVKLYTHGNFIDDARVAMLLRRRVAEVHISFYSMDPCVHEQVTRVPGSHAKSLKAINLLLDAGIIVVLKCPLMRFNFEGRDELKAFAESRGIKIVFTPLIQPTYTGEFHTLSTAVPSCELPNIFLDTMEKSELLAFAASKEHQFDDRALCGAARSIVSINPVGNIQACSLMGGMSAGNIRNQPFGEIWRTSALLDEIRGYHQEDRHDCKRCGNARYCGFCMANSWHAHKEFMKPSAVICEQANGKRLAVSAYRRRLPVVHVDTGG